MIVRSRSLRKSKCRLLNSSLKSRRTILSRVMRKTKTILIWLIKIIRKMLTRLKSYCMECKQKKKGESRWMKVSTKMMMLISNRMSIIVIRINKK